MIMMSFCKRSVHSFLGTTTNNDNNVTVLKSPPSPRCRNIPSPVDGLSLIAVTCNSNNLKPSNNVLESTLIKSSSTSTGGGSGAVSGFDIGVGNAKKDSGGFGFIDDIGGGVDGLMSCTESLGFESSDERRTDEQLDQLLGKNEEIRESELCSSTTTTTTVKRNQWRQRIKVRSEPRSFPPPLSSLKQNGQPSFYLRPVRKDGRLELTEVRIDRAEILHASRCDGRLRLHLIRDEDEEEEEEIEDEQIEELEKVEDEIESVGEWKLPAVANAGGGDGFRRCYELVNHHHHNHHHHSNLHVWSQRQHCVTTG